MQDDSFDGTNVLEKLAKLDLVEAFFEAVDSDDFSKAQRLMRRASIDHKTILIVLQKMQNAED